MQAVVLCLFKGVHEVVTHTEFRQSKALRPKRNTVSFTSFHIIYCKVRELFFIFSSIYLLSTELREQYKYRAFASNFHELALCSRGLALLKTVL